MFEADSRTTMQSLPASDSMASGEANVESRPPGALCGRFCIARP